MVVLLELLLSLVVVTGDRTEAQEPPQSAGTVRELLLSGSDWSIAACDAGQGIARRAFADGFPAQEAIAATVPGDVHWDLERAGKIPPIYYGLNSRESGWVAGKEWWYRKHFHVPAAWRDQTVRLHFEAVDYLTEVWLNEHWLGRHEGQFTPFDFDVSETLRHGDVNTLTVLIHPAPSAVPSTVDGTEWSMMQALRKAYPYWKSQTNAGWDWGAKIITMGIWKDVRLVASDHVSLTSAVVLPQIAAPYDHAALDIRVDLKASPSRSITLHYCVRCPTASDPPVQLAQAVTVPPDGQCVSFHLEIDHPQLWWPHGYGLPHLYELEIAASDTGQTAVLDSTRVKFGIRDLQIVANPPSPGASEYIDYATGEAVTRHLPQPPPEQRYLMQINGRRIFARGANWLPCDLLFGRPREPFYEHLIRLAAEANCNLFRIWGGGVVDKPVFYDLCDRYGIMLFQEFPNAGPLLAETNEALAITAEETRQILPLLMNHPCVVRYGGGNEWYRDAHNSRQMAQLRTLCGTVDPTRPFHDPDPETDAQRHGPHWYDYPQSYETYNTGRPLTAGPDNPVEWTEYGASGAAGVETLQAMMPAANLWPIQPNDPFWNWHKAFHAFGEDTWLSSAQYRRLFGELPDLETTVRCSQFAQAEGLRYANQSMRRFQWHRSACTFWTFNEPWPNAAHGCVVEYSGRPKMAYYYAKQSFAPVDISAVYSNLIAEVETPWTVDVWGAQDSAQDQSPHWWRWRIFDLHGILCAEEVQKAPLLPEGSGRIGSVTWTPPAKMAGDVALLWLELFDSASCPVARQLYVFGIQDKAQIQSASPPLRPLLQAPPATLRLQGTDWQQGASGEYETMVEVQNVGAHPALFVRLSVGLPTATIAHFGDNYFFLPPGESRQIRVTLSAERNNPALPEAIRVQAWNSESLDVRRRVQEPCPTPN